MDDVGEEVERIVNDALRYPFHFHGINKIVVRLGPSPNNAPDYIELMGVAKKQYTAFSADEYVGLAEERRRRELILIVQSVFDWLLEEFEDAEFIKAAQQNLGW
ncbi:MAG: hypothetical protein HRU11_07705 [Parvularculaceae bacterium]|nr:hypothetical protein [Parvularculaceae bacterium]